MKAISLWNPWAHFMALGLKTIETRSWSTSYRGLLAIHAAKRSLDKVGLGLLRSISPDALSYGCIVAVVEIYDCVSTDRFFRGTGVFGRLDLGERERMLGDYSCGRFAWLTRNVKRLREPLPMRGRQGLWNLSAEEIKIINERIA